MCPKWQESNCTVRVMISFLLHLFLCLGLMLKREQQEPEHCCHSWLSDMGYVTGRRSKRIKHKWSSDFLKTIIEAHLSSIFFSVHASESVRNMSWEINEAFSLLTITNLTSWKSFITEHPSTLTFPSSTGILFTHPDISLFSFSPTWTFTRRHFSISGSCGNKVPKTFPYFCLLEITSCVQVWDTLHVLSAFQKQNILFPNNNNNYCGQPWLHCNI